MIRFVSRQTRFAWPRTRLASRLALPLLLALAATATAATPAPQPDDFARGLPLTVDAAKPLQRLELPAAVYGGVVRADLGDLRVFNGAGAPVPHTLLPPAEKEASISWRPVPLFPLPATAAKEDVAVQVRTDGNGAVVQVERRGAGTPAEPTPRLWLVDLSQQPQPVDRLRLRWAEAVEPFALAVEVAVSDDLTRWQPLTAATLAELAHGDHRLRRDEIAVGRAARYLRLSSPAPLTLESAEIVQAGAAAQSWQWHTTAAGTATDDGLVFDSEGHWPTLRLQLELASLNQVAAVEVASAATPAGPWRTHGSHRFHRLRLDDAELRNEPMPVDARGDRYWRLSGPDVAALGGARLQLGWLPHQLLFLQQGDAPFTLAYGSGRVSAPDAPLPALLRTPDEDAGMTARASAGEPVELGGSAALETPVTLPWQRVGLWALLLVAVALLGWMAWRLVAEMNQTRDEQTDGTP